MGRLRGVGDEPGTTVRNRWSSRPRLGGTRRVPRCTGSDAADASGRRPETDQVEDEFAVIGWSCSNQYLLSRVRPRRLTATPARRPRPRRATGGDSIVVRLIWVTPSEAQARVAHDEGPVGGEERIDREEPERRRTIEDDEVVVDSSSAIARRSLAPIGSVSSCDRA